jgi:hypothetical protein
MLASSRFLPNEPNNQRLAALKGVHQGRRAFLIGNGPSLTVEDLDRLQGEITFASNKIDLIFDQTAWRPTYYTVCDAIVARNNRDRIRELPLTKIFAYGVSEHFSKQDDITWVNPPSTEGDRRWDLIEGCRAGHSVVNLDIKLAHWMGITEMIVIGVDFSFSVPTKTTGEEVFGNKVIVSEGEVNHFHPDYRKPGETWTVPKLDIQQEEFTAARALVESSGGRILNASRRTKLEAWERVDFDTLFPHEPAHG